MTTNFKQIKKTPRSIQQYVHTVAFNKTQRVSHRVYLRVTMQVHRKTELGVWGTMRLEKGILLEELESVTDNWILDHVF